MFLHYKRRLWRKIPHDNPVTRNEITMAITNPYGLFSMPLMRFIPRSDAIRVGNIMIIVTAVSVRITVFILLLMMLE